MPRMRNDPNFNICPDYATDTFANTCAHLVNNNTTEEQAIQFLRNIWETNNDADKVAWQCQLEDEMKGMCTPRSGEYMELWYFTNDSLDKASTKKTIDDDAMILSTSVDGLTAWVSSASTQSARAVINNKNLPFKEFCQACPRFLTAIDEADWPVDRIRMMALFWRNIQVHKFRSLRDPIAQKALLAYQAEQCKCWHVAVKTSVGPYNLSLINEKVLEATRERVYWEEQDKRDNAQDYRYVLDEIHTGLLNAKQLGHGMTLTTPFVHKLAECSPCETTSSFAAIGNASTAAMKSTTIAGTSALVVAHPLMELTQACPQAQKA
ncbi:uncharacterized protein F5147DRAFT_655252 [Suillus discolor]|uniref:Uncharacterized protein n=1 Tax=Suillus discolor TaxID=1912936 RepID=A0A9P7F263_9AGAM|nr:uncharacterized protein F5147DRAFT_655252 [Suillus discolor]KAG2101608.1 hypothetical protein F5147DRAFT_655252 [Suillus discolor]